MLLHRGLIRYGLVEDKLEPYTARLRNCFLEGAKVSSGEQRDKHEAGRAAFRQSNRRFETFIGMYVGDGPRKVEFTFGTEQGLIDPRVRNAQVKHGCLV